MMIIINNNVWFDELVEDEDVEVERVSGAQRALGGHLY